MLRGHGKIQNLLVYLPLTTSTSDVDDFIEPSKSTDWLSSSKSNVRIVGSSVEYASYKETDRVHT